MSILDWSKTVVWFGRLFFILTQSPLSPTPIHLPPNSLFNDNNGAVFLPQEAALNSRSKHNDIWHHYVWYLVKHNIIRPCQIDTKDMPDDYLTKAAPKIIVDNCRRLGGKVPLLELKERYVLLFLFFLGILGLPREFLSLFLFLFEVLKQGERCWQNVFTSHISSVDYSTSHSTLSSVVKESDLLITSVV